MVRELTPHAEEWEETTFPDWVFRRMGELGSLGPSMTERCGGQDREYYCTSCSPRDGALALRRPGDARADRHGAPTDLRVRHRRAEAGVPGPGDPRRAISCLGIGEPDAGSDVSGIKTRAVLDGDDWVINGSKMFITDGHRAEFIVLDPDAGPSPRATPEGGRSPLDMERPGVIRGRDCRSLTKPMVSGTLRYPRLTAHSDDQQKRRLARPVASGA
jgi:alkylation response protein AidB-like acyl-CoA dehydrogenase